MRREEDYLDATRCTGSKTLAFVVVSYSEKMSLPRAKAPALPRHGTRARIGRPSATPEPAVQRTRPRTSTNAAAARLQQTLRRGGERSCRGAAAAKLVAGRAIALLVCNGRGCHRSQACRRRSMHLSMIITCCA